jgi:hypothetical protein
MTVTIIVISHQINATIIAIKKLNKHVSLNPKSSLGIKHITIESIKLINDIIDNAVIYFFTN